MILTDEIKRCAAAVERRLDETLAAEADNARTARLLEAMRYAVLGGGKRIRPFLLISSARLFGVEDSQAVEAAAALECVHCYSLAHDDLPAMDDDAMRRGRPSLHIAFGEATAILAGDALLTLAFELLSGPRTHPDPAIRAALVCGLAQASGWRGMAGGQALDLAAEGQALDLEQVVRIHARKTGALIAFACEAGAILGKAESQARASLSRYGEALGLAYQIADDLLDVEGDASALGKAVAKDEKRGKATIVALLGIDAARKRLTELVQTAEGALAPFGAAARPLIEIAHLVASRDR